MINQKHKWKIKEILKKDFPEQLKKINNCPSKLFYRGNWDNKIFDNSLAVVGSRRMSRYGQEVVKKFIPELVAKKITIVSGFMYGIDSAAHSETLENGGTTVAILGGGLDIITPTENQKMYWEILEKGGLIISEYEPDFLPTLWSFPLRNRIVSGLTTLGVLVIEAGLKSGSLITAKLALKQGKKLYAVPGPINYSLGVGVNHLIKEKKAIMTTEVTDIFGSKIVYDQVKIEFADGLEKEILEYLNIEPMTADELSYKLHKEINLINQKLSIMNIEGKVNESQGKWYD